MSRVITDLDDRDRQARAVLHTQLRARRELLGWSQQKVGQAVGADGSVVRRWERLGVDQSYAATIARWAEALGMRLVMEPAGFPPVAARRPAGPVSELLAAVGAEMSGRTAAAWQSAAVLADLTRIRVACRVTQEQLAAVFGVSEQAVSLLETGESSTALVVLQRHARGIARCARIPAYLAVHLEEDTTLV